MANYWLKITKINNVYARITSTHPTIMHDLYNYFHLHVENFMHQPKYKVGAWDGKVALMHKDGTLPLGLTKYAYKFVLNDELDIWVDPQIMEKQEGIEEDFIQIADSWLAEELNGSPLVLRNFQIEGAIKGLKYRRGILEHATASGKSLTIALMIKYSLIKKNVSKVLIVVPTIGLVHQMHSDFLSYGIKPTEVGKFYGKQKDIDEPIIVSTWQSIYKQEEFLQEFDMIVCDECHGLVASEINSVSRNAINAKIRIGTTGSMPDNKCSRLTIEAMLGPVLHIVTPKELMDINQIAPIEIRIPFISYSKEIEKQLKGVPYEIEQSWLETNNTRNEIIKKFAEMHLNNNENILILVDHLDHADVLESKLKTIKDVEVFKVTGEVKDDKREEIRKYTNLNKKIALVATYKVFSTGISINRLHVVMFPSVGKSKTRILQSIGRGLRLHCEKEKLVLYDFADSLPFSENHLKQRLTKYEKYEFPYKIKEVNLG